MLSRVLLVCVLVSVLGAGSSLGCRWMQHKFRQYSGDSLELLKTMANNSTNSTDDDEVKDTVAFPHHLYSHMSTASAEDKLGFTVQLLDEVAALFEENHSSASWEERTARDFLDLVTQQADGLRSCVGSHVHKKYKKLQMYFKKLALHVEQMGHTADAWELLRKEVKTHLMRADQLISSLITTD